MNTRLAIQASPKPREVLVSLISRTAAMHGIPMATFAKETGLSVRGVLETTPDAISKLMELFDLDKCVLEELVSWSGKQISGEVRMSFRGETIVSRALRNPIVRGCPLCLQDDAMADRMHANQHMYLRGEWLFRHSVLCMTHAVPLMPLWTVDKRLDRYDIAGLIAKVDLPSLVEKAAHKATTITSFDIWLDKRLTGGTDETWLAKIPIGHAAKFCVLLGDELARLDEHHPSHIATKKPSRVLGFDAASAGEAPILQAMSNLATLAQNHSDKPKKAFGRLYSWLSHDTKNDPDCDLFRDLMREVILQNWPFGAGETILGETLNRRRLHSVTSAAADLDVGPDIMRRLLISKNHIAAGDPRPNTRLTVKAEVITRVQKDIASLVGIGEMRKSMNVTVSQFKALVDGGLIKPARHAVSQRQPWDPKDGQQLLVRLLVDAWDLKSGNASWEHIYKSALRVRVPVQTIVKAIDDGGVLVGKAIDLEGFAGIYVEKSSVDQAVRPSRPDLPSVAEFAKKIGLHRDGGFSRLVASGEVTVTRMLNPLTAKETDYMSGEDVQRFYQRFTTLKIVANQVSRESRDVSRELNQDGVHRYSPDGIDYGPIFLIEDIQSWVDSNRQ